MIHLIRDPEQLCETRGSPLALDSDSCPLTAIDFAGLTRSAARMFPPKLNAFADDLQYARLPLG